MLMIMEGFLCLYRLLHPYFILSEVFFSHLYYISYLMLVNSVSDFPCLLVCVFLLLMSSYFVESAPCQGKETQFYPSAVAYM